MNDLNHCQFIGRVGQNPEIKYMANGDAVANFSIACNKSWKDKQGQKQERAEWIRCTAYRKLAEIIGEYISQGSQMYVSGSMQTRKWTDNNGQDKYTTEIIVDQMQMLGGGNGNNQGQQNSGYQQGNNQQGGYQQQGNQNRGQQNGNGQPQGNQNQGKPPMAEPDFDFDDDLGF